MLIKENSNILKYSIKYCFVCWVLCTRNKINFNMQYFTALACATIPAVPFFIGFAVIEITSLNYIEKMMRSRYLHCFFLILSFSNPCNPKRQFPSLYKVVRSCTVKDSTILQVSCQSQAKLDDQLIIVFVHTTEITRIMLLLCFTSFIWTRVWEKLQLNVCRIARTLTMEGSIPPSCRIFVNLDMNAIIQKLINDFLISSSPFTMKVTKQTMQYPVVHSVSMYMYMYSIFLISA